MCIIDCELQVYLSKTFLIKLKIYRVTEVSNQCALKDYGCRQKSQSQRYTYVNSLPDLRSVHNLHYNQ